MFSCWPHVRRSYRVYRLAAMLYRLIHVVVSFCRRRVSKLLVCRRWWNVRRRRRSSDRPTPTQARIRRYNDDWWSLIGCLPAGAELVSSDQIVAAIGRRIASLSRTIHHPRAAVVAVDCSPINSCLDFLYIPDRVFAANSLENCFLLHWKVDCAYVFIYVHVVVGIWTFENTCNTYHNSRTRFLSFSYLSVSPSVVDSLTLASNISSQSSLQSISSCNL